MLNSLVCGESIGSRRADVSLSVCCYKCSLLRREKSEYTRHVECWMKGGRKVLFLGHEAVEFRERETIDWEKGLVEWRKYKWPLCPSCLFWIVLCDG